MAGFTEHDLDEQAFGEKAGNIMQSFDAFPKAKPQYITYTAGGGKWTVAMLIILCILLSSELKTWWHGYETQSFSIEKGVGHDMQINLDLVVAMSCADVHINVQDAAGDRILAGEKLRRDTTNWAQWVDGKGIHSLGQDEQGNLFTAEDFLEHEDVHDIIANAGGRKTKFAKTPKIKGFPLEGNSCRIYGSLDVNKVQGDFHITARGHGYHEFGTHLDHSAFNFSHVITELSFGDYYPSLLNPLDKTTSSTSENFQKYQYFLSIVPTVYSIDVSYNKRIVITNQYAVTDQSQVVDSHSIPGIFFKYDIEPMLLIIVERQDDFFQFLIKAVNIFSGVLVAGHWGFTLSEWAMAILKKKRSTKNEGVLNGRTFENDY